MTVGCDAERRALDPALRAWTLRRRSIAGHRARAVSCGGREARRSCTTAIPAPRDSTSGRARVVRRVRARNVDACHAKITARLVSSQSGLIAAEESRSINLNASADGWAEPNLSDISSVANVPLCPDYHDESIVDTSYKLMVRLEDSRGSNFCVRSRDEA